MTQLVAKFAKRFVEPMFNVGSSGGSRVLEWVNLNLTKYIESQTMRCSNIKTLVSPDLPVNIFSIYTGTTFRCGDRYCDEKALTSTIEKGVAAAIVGSAGSGKSMFMKCLYLNLCSTKSGIIPLFVELRGLNNVSMKDLEAYIYHSIVNPGAQLSERQFRSLLSDGGFYLILDGFDEVDPELRTTVEEQILDLQIRSPKLTIVVSSRGDERFFGWQNFEVYHVEPLSKRQVVGLIRNLNYDGEVKRRFIQEINRSLYHKHTSFLSNPLLATMMLLTYEQFADIPDKVHIFYEQAFETLFARHDSGKQAGFQRKRYTTLPINEFRNILSAFSISTYVKSSLFFSEAEILEFIETAAKYEKSKVNPSQFLADLIESVCIMQKDGFHIAYVHRSFQEYFAALFVSRSPAIDVGDLLDSIVGRSSDAVIPMLFDINREFIEREWIKPRVDAICQRLSDFNGDINSFAREFLGEFVLYRFAKNPRLTLVRRSDGADMYLTVSKLYPAEFRKSWSILKEWKPRDKHLVEFLTSDSRPKGHLTPIDLDDLPSEFLSGSSIEAHFESMKKCMFEVQRSVSRSVKQSKKIGNILVSPT